MALLLFVNLPCFLISQDTPAYAIHHIATVALVLFSAHTGVTRFGGVIMFFFDWADPPMLLAKALVYLSRKPTDWYQWCADRLFETFAVTFFVTRNVIFSYVVYVCFSFDMKKHSQISPTSWGVRIQVSKRFSDETQDPKWVKIHRQTIHNCARDMTGDIHTWR